MTELTITPPADIQPAVDRAVQVRNAGDADAESVAPMQRRKKLVLIAHDNRKKDLLEWARYNRDTLSQHQLHATGTTGSLLSSELGLPVNCFLSGPLGGDQQVGAAIAEGRIDVVIFFWDPLEPQPHDVDVKALLRIAVVYNVPIACNRSTADFVLSSPLVGQVYDRYPASRGSAIPAGAGATAPEAETAA
jgi:methylglyoxal synthase